MSSEQTLQTYLKKAGIEPAATNIYIELTKEGPSSALQLAKKTRVSRTQIYRYLDALKNSGLVSAEQLTYGTLFRALPLTNIDGLIADHEAQTASLRRDLGVMTTLLQHLAGSNDTKATVHHHYGLAGIKQANWNLTKADGEFRVLEAAHISEHLDKTFSQRLRERFIERNLVSYDLTNATSINAADIEPFSPSRTHYQYIGPHILTINFEVYIYNDVVTLLDYRKDNMLAIEIHHPSLHAMMQQLYDAMWSLGKPLEVSPV